MMMLKSVFIIVGLTFQHKGVIMKKSIFSLMLIFSPALFAMEQVLVAPPLNTDDEIRRFCQLDEEERRTARDRIRRGATITEYAGTQGLSPDEIYSEIQKKDESWLSYIGKKTLGKEYVSSKLRVMLGNLINDADEVSRTVQEIIIAKVVPLFRDARERVLVAEERALVAENTTEAASDRADFCSDLAQDALEEASQESYKKKELDQELLAIKVIANERLIELLDTKLKKEITEGYAQVSTGEELKKVDAEIENKKNEWVTARAIPLLKKEVFKRMASNTEEEFCKQWEQLKAEMLAELEQSKTLKLFRERSGDSDILKEIEETQQAARNSSLRNIMARLDALSFHRMNSWEINHRNIGNDKVRLKQEDGLMLRAAARELKPHTPEDLKVALQRIGDAFQEIEN